MKINIRHHLILNQIKILDLSVAQIVKNLPAMQEAQFLSLGWEDALEKRMATHSSILAWRIPWTEDPGRLQSMGLQKESDIKILNWNANYDN